MGFFAFTFTFCVLLILYNIHLISFIFKLHNALIYFHFLSKSSKLSF